MAFTERYRKAKEKLLKDKDICKENRLLYEDYFKAEEKKLKMNNGGLLDERNHKTLLGYVYKIKNINEWFRNKPLKHISEKDFEKVFNDLIEGKIKNNKGEAMQDVSSYIDKLFKSKLFRMAGLNAIVEKVTEDYKPRKKEGAHWIEEREVDAIIDNAIGNYKLLFQLSWDIGENTASILMTKKRDYRKQYNEVTKEHEYFLTLRKELLKRARKARTEPTRFLKTTKLLDVALKDLDDDDYIFQRNDNKVMKDCESKGQRVPMTLRCAEKVFDNIVERLKIKAVPDGSKPTIKTLRSSMACDCLKKGWSVEEINVRLGHEPWSKVLKPYIDALAIDKSKPKIREYKANLEGVNDKLTEQRGINQLLDKRLAEQTKKIEELENDKNILEKDYKQVSERFKLVEQGLKHLLNRESEKEASEEDYEAKEDMEAEKMLSPEARKKIESYSPKEREKLIKEFEEDEKKINAKIKVKNIKKMRKKEQKK